MSAALMLPPNFMRALEGISDPEQKRKAIGGKFIDIFDAEAKKIGDVDWLVQGTLYPDVIESVSLTRRFRHDQITSQRRRPARKNAPQADRAAA